MFNVFKKILTGKKIQEEDAKKVSPFILLRWLSGDPRLMPLASQLNQLKTLPNNYDLLIAIQGALGGNIKFIPYPSSKKSDSQGMELKDNLELIIKYFDVGEAAAAEYYDWMVQKCPHEIPNLRKMFKVDLPPGKKGW